MKYTITINQLALNNTSLDLIDAAILEYLYIYCTTPNTKVEAQRILDDEGYWTWVDYDQIMKDLPMMRIKSKGSITPRIQKLAKEKFIATKKLAGFKLYMRVLPRIESAFIKPNAESDKDESAFNLTNASVHETERWNDQKQLQLNQRSLKRTNNNTSINNNYTKIQNTVPVKKTGTAVSVEENQKRITKTGMFLEKFNELFGTKYQITTGRTEKLRMRCKTYTLEQIFQALENLSKSSFHRGKNERGWVADPDFLIRSDEQIDKWLNSNSSKTFKPAYQKSEILELLHGPHK